MEQTIRELLAKTPSALTVEEGIRIIEANFERLGRDYDVRGLLTYLQTYPACRIPAQTVYDQLLTDAIVDMRPYVGILTTKVFKGGQMIMGFLYDDLPSTNSDYVPSDLLRSDEPSLLAP